MRRECAHVPVLSLEELKALPEAEEYDAGIYFLWLNDELQYIGKSDHICERLALQDYANKFAKLRASKWPKPIPYDRHTALVLDRGMYRKDGLKDQLRDYERAYIANYTPPMNHIGQNPGT